MGAAPHGQQRPRGDLRTIDGDIAGGVADAKDEDPLAGERLRSAVVVGMKLLASESVSAGKGRLGIPRIPVVTVGDQHGAVPPGMLRPGIPLPGRDVPAASRYRLGPGHLGPKLDLRTETEFIYEVIEVPHDRLVAQIVRITIWYRERGVLHALPR